MTIEIHKRDPIPRRLVNVTGDPDRATDLLMLAMDHGQRVTFGYWETRYEKTRDPDTGKITRRKIREKDPDTGRMRDTYVHVVRTGEFFDVNQSKEGNVFFNYLDSMPDFGAPASIRSVRPDRITDITVHRTECMYVNRYFVAQIRAFAESAAMQGAIGLWHQINKLTDDAIWCVVKGSSNPDEAIEKITQHLTEQPEGAMT